MEGSGMVSDSVDVPNSQGSHVAAADPAAVHTVDPASDEIQEYIATSGLNYLVDGMVRGLLRAHPRPINPSKWLLQYLKDHLQAKPAVPGEHPYTPNKLWMSVEAHGGDDAIGGLYRIQERRVNGMPVWGSGQCRIYSSASGYWLVTDDAEKMQDNKGVLSSAVKHDFVHMPHKVCDWEMSSAGVWVPVKVGVSDSLLFDSPAMRISSQDGDEDREGVIPPRPQSPSFLPGRWETPPTSAKPPGAKVPGSIFLPGALTVKPIHRLTGENVSSGHAGMQGWRSYMEDTFAQKVHREDPNLALFLVCDGHGGKDVARHVATHFSDLMLTQAQERYVRHADMTHTVRLLDEDILSLYHESGCTATWIMVDSPNIDTFENSGRFRHFRSNSLGSTTGSVNISDVASADNYKRISDTFKVQIGSIGDSRAVVWCGETQEVVFETVDHKPTEPAEQKRLRDAGYDYGERIDGLAVSRAFGDRDEKSIGLICDPDITDMELRCGDVIALGSDGVFEQLTSAEVMRIAVSTLESSDGDCGAAAAAVCDASIKCGVTDNISCLIISLADGASVQATVTLPRVECVPGPYTCAWDAGFKQGYLEAVQQGGATLAEALSKRYADISIQLSKMKEDETSIDSIALRDEFALFHNNPDELEKLRSAHTTAERLAWFELWAASDAVVSRD